MDFETWKAELKRLAVSEHGYDEECFNTFDWDSWKEYYDDGFTPKDALMEEDYAAMKDVD